MRLAAVFLLVPSLLAQGVLDRIRGEKKPPAASTPAGDFTQEFYQNLRNYAEGLYKQKDRPDFRLGVDRDYEALLKQHSDRAFEINTKPHSEVKVVLEDRFRVFDGLYDNLMVQDAVNRIGQDSSPKWSERLVTFRLLADPVPSAETFATGTIYVTTGLVASLDNRAQLSYILAHEAAHAAKEHWKTRIMIEHAKEEYAKSQADRAAQLMRFSSIVGMGGGAILGASLGHSVVSTFAGGIGGALVGDLIGRQFTPNPRLNVDWNIFEEDEADEIAFKTLVDAKLNAAEIPRLYETMDHLSVKDDKVGMGFWGNRSRMQERLAKLRVLMKANNLEALKLSGNDPDFKKLVSELKRDNGIMAYHRDMLDMARANLEQAVDTRSADPAATYYYAKILKATAKTDAERTQAIELFSQAIQTDKANHAYGAYLHRAVAMLDRGSPADKQQAAELLRDYVEHYGLAMDELNTARGSRLPPHMDVIVDYMRRAGVTDYTYISATTPLPAAQPAPPQAPVVAIPVVNTTPLKSPVKKK